MADLKRCPGCEQIEQRQAALSRDNKLGKGVHIVLKRNAQD
ncbi:MULTISPECIES: hypothetical protein [Nocardiopsis]|nr:MULTISPECIES: hypothetical protein [Nocardiopsis]